jgi:hypothetical protein
MRIAAQRAAACRRQIVFEGLPDAIRDAILAYVNDAWRAALMSRI